MLLHLEQALLRLPQMVTVAASLTTPPLAE